MANPTTNYGFVLPTSTDLVTDLPADFDVALQGVDTRLKALQPGTTLGDIAYSSATANTNTRLAIGTTGQVLTVAGGVPSWASAGGAGVTLVTTAAFSAVSAINLNSVFTSTYTNYQLIVSCSGSAATDLNMRMRASAADNSANNYTWGLQGMQFAGASQYNVSSGGTALVSLFNIGALGTVTRNHFVYDILNPETTDYTTYTGSNIYQNTSVNGIMTQGQGVLSVTTSYDGITLYPATGTITGTYWIYGYKKA